MKDLFVLDPNIISLNHNSFGAASRPFLNVCQSWQYRLEQQPFSTLSWKCKEKSKKVLKFGHEKVATYGIGRNFSKEHWHHFSSQSIRQGLLECTKPHDPYIL